VLTFVIKIFSVLKVSVKEDGGIDIHLMV